jgi:dihydroorotase
LLTHFLSFRHQVKACGPTVACTITLHHLSLTIDDWAGNGLNYCKPVAKSPDDREALRQVIREGEIVAWNKPFSFLLLS